MKFTISILLCAFLFIHAVTAQYAAHTTYKGHIKLTVVVNDSTYIFSSSELVTNINYKSKEIEMLLDLSLLNFGIDSLQDSIKAMTEKVAVYKGRMKDSHSPEGNKEHPPVETKITGELQIGKIIKQIDFDATFEQVAKGGNIVTGIFKCNFSIPVKDFRIAQYVPGIKDIIAVDIKQDLLE